MYFLYYDHAHKGINWSTKEVSEFRTRAQWKPQTAQMPIIFGALHSWATPPAQLFPQSHPALLKLGAMLLAQGCQSCDWPSFRKPQVLITDPKSTTSPLLKRHWLTNPYSLFCLFVHHPKHWHIFNAQDDIFHFKGQINYFSPQLIFANQYFPTEPTFSGELENA